MTAICGMGNIRQNPSSSHWLDAFGDRKNSKEMDDIYISIFVKFVIENLRHEHAYKLARQPDIFEPLPLLWTGEYNMIMFNNDGSLFVWKVEHSNAVIWSEQHTNFVFF